MSVKSLVELLKSQPRSVTEKPNGWSKLVVKVGRSEFIEVTIREECITFFFNKRGQFLGIANWKE